MVETYMIRLRASLWKVHSTGGTKSMASRRFNQLQALFDGIQIRLAVEKNAELSK